MSIRDLPAELLTDIFEQVVYDDSLVDPYHPTNISLSRWDKRPTKPDWVLVGPNEDVHSKQTKAYTAAKVCSDRLAMPRRSLLETLRLSCFPVNNGTESPTT